MSNSNYGPENPHPLSRMKSELVWEGKYDEYGRKREASLPSFPLVMQKIETIDEPRDRSKAQGSLFDERTAHRDDFQNRLIWGDNKLSLAALLGEFRGKINLIYIDPPFDVGADFTMPIQIGNEADEIHKEQSVLEAVAYRDMWGRNTDSYLQMMHERLVLMRDLLHEKGSIYVHCDHRVNSYLRLILDEVFGKDNLRNEIIWSYPDSPGRPYDKFPPKHDTIFRYSKGGDFTFNADEVRVPILEASKKRYEKPRYLINSQGKRFEYVGGKAAEEGKIPETVWQIPVVKGTTAEHASYTTQKPELLLERIIRASSNVDDLVADFFCGSGTTLAVAERLGRRWIGCDLGRYAIHTTRKRLIGVQRQMYAHEQQYRSFAVLNLGRYERQWWQQSRLLGANAEHRATVLKFFRAQPLEISPSPHLHATKAGAYVHVDDIDSILTYEELSEVAAAAQQSGGKALICLAWEFQMDLKTRAQALEAELGIDIRLTYIPREIMEPNRDVVQFFDAAALEAEALVERVIGCIKVDVKLTRFIPSLTEVPEKELKVLQERAVRSPFDFIDFWAVDFEHREGKPFEHHWQDYRTRKDRSLLIQSNCGWEYDSPGKKLICLKVIDVFGIDTTKVIEVTV